MKSSRTESSQVIPLSCRKSIHSPPPSLPDLGKTRPWINRPPYLTTHAPPPTTNSTSILKKRKKNKKGNTLILLLQSLGLLSQTQALRTNSNSTLANSIFTLKKPGFLITTSFSSYKLKSLIASLNSALSYSSNTHKL